MAKPNPANERTKREYFGFLREAKGRDTSTIDRVAMALARFEDSTGRKDFRKFHREQAIAFKRRLSETVNSTSGKRLSKATTSSILRDLKAFFEWLSREPGYRSKLQYSDADYFSPSAKDAAIARASREKSVPTAEQVERVLTAMPAETTFERRDRALLAFASLTGARVNALASFHLGHVDLHAGFVDQDAREVRTKAGKSFRTYFMPVCESAFDIVSDWIAKLRAEYAWSDNDPLFPATAMGVGGDGAFQPVGISRDEWKTTQPIRDAFKRGFHAAGLPYANPHSIRDMLVHHAMRLDLTPAQMKAWSQNLGHEQVLTTFTSYGRVSIHQQGELIRATATGKAACEGLDDAALMAAIAKRLCKAA